MNDSDHVTTDGFANHDLANHDLANQDVANQDVAVVHARPIDVRRAVLGLLMRRAAAGADEGLSLREMRAVLLSHDRIEVEGKRLADLVRWQMRRGRVRRVRRGRYAFVVGSMSRSSAWRCLHWQLVARRWWERDHIDLG